MPVEKTALDSIDLNALHVAAKAAAEDVIRSHGWKGMIEEANLLGTDERYLVLADPAAVAGLITEIKTLRRALGGMLFAFDDGVGHDWSKDLLDYARQVAPAVEYKPDLLLIQPLQVKRDEYGFWTHPAWPDNGDECALPLSWFGDNGLEYCVIEMENDGPEELNAEWLDAGGYYDCTPWQPSKPAGDGWFTFSIHDTEDGPICVWVRHKVQP